jgi:uncharacterized protein YndB with AHSA1/START domain
MKLNDKIEVTVVLDAEVEKVWDYYTNPEHITKWNFAHPSWHCPNAENNMQIGGTYKARMEAKDRSFGFDFEAVYTNIIEGKEYTYQFNEREATVSFNEINNQTELTVKFDPETENPIELQKEGWQAILNNFKKYVETN